MTDPTPAQLAAMEPLLSDRTWRLNNLYFIVDEHGNKVQFTMRPPQLKLLQNKHWRNVILKARQLGFTTFIDIFGLDLVLWNTNIRAGIVAHTREDAQVIFRDKIKFAYDNLPGFIRKWFPARKNDAGELLLGNNSSMRVGTSFRSATAQFLHVSELGAICSRYPQKANEIKTGSLPAVHEGSFCFVESTARGNEGYFYDLCMEAQHATESGKPLSPLAFKFHFFPWYDNASYRLDPASVTIPDRITDYCDELQAGKGIIITPDQRAWYAETERNLGSDMMQEHPSTPEEAFTQSIEGAYYRTQIDQAYRDGRVCEGRVEPGIPTHTAWDIGHGDSTSIWFFQETWDQLRMVDFYENSGEGLGHYVEVLRDKGYNYGRHYGPHDLQVHEWTSGKTRIETAAADHGIRFEVAPNVPIADGIEIVRSTFRSVWFWESRCDQGLKALQNYRKEWDDKGGTWKNNPRHDWASHPADSFRYLCLCWRPGQNSGVGSGRTSKRWGY